jgi:hypothetical protein
VDGPLAPAALVVDQTRFHRTVVIAQATDRPQG